MVGNSSEQAVNAAIAALHSALAPPEGAITASTEAQLQTAIATLRRDRCDNSLLARLEEMAVGLNILVNAKCKGRPNLYASRLARLRRSFVVELAA
jgi:hypothetical protein